MWAFHQASYVGSLPILKEAPFSPLLFSKDTLKCPLSASCFIGKAGRNLEFGILSLKATAKEAATETKNAEPEGAAGTVDSKESAKASRRAEDWERALKLQQSGALHDVKVEACNNGGLVVRFRSIFGFLPFSQIGNGRILKEEKSTSDVAKDLIGKTLTVKVIEVSKDDKRLVVSEKKAVWLQSIQQLKEGDIFEGKVNCVTDFGAFVDLLFPDGSYPVTGLVHVSELSWDRVYNPRDLVQEGQVVKVKVTGVDLDRMRLALSMKQLEGDPLLETLDSLMPQESDNEIVNEDEASTEPLPGLEEICQELLKEDGIDEVTPGRMAIEKRVVSQDLELWLSSAPVENGNLTLLARAGRQGKSRDDPDVHIQVFEQYAELKHIAEQEWGEYFPHTLKEAARKWYYHYPAGSL
ncbi:hypothetical protein L7F22_001780 [Adiantum nelumboides]|nr:hypothetical protein [Adiantum nelumboides]